MSYLKNEELFMSFSNEIQEWSTSYKIPESANQDIKRYLELRKKRFEKYELKYSYSLHKWLNNKIFGSYKPAKINTFRNWCSYKEKTLIKNKKNKRLYKKTRRINFYEVIYDCENSELSEIPYNCPNCGSVSDVNILRSDGCPYCKTKYMISDLFPKVINYYTYDNPAVDGDEIKRWLNIIYIISFLLMFLIFFVRDDNEYSLILTVIFNLLYSGLLAFIITFGIFFYCGLFYVFSIFVRAFISAIMLPDYIVSKRLLTNDLKNCFSDYKYEYFEGQISSVLKNIIFSDDQLSYPLYKGECIERFKNIVDSEIYMINSYKLIEKNSNDIVICLKITLRNIYYENNRVIKKKEKYNVTMKHRLNGSLCEEFSIYSINCKNCGSSFDVTNQNKCPYCNSEFEMDDKNWVITSIECL